MARGSRARPEDFGFLLLWPHHPESHQGILLKCVKKRTLRTYLYPYQILQHASQMRRLNLAGNKLRTFPSEIWQLESLEELNLSRNILSSIDLPVAPKGSQAALCFRLKTIDLSFNKLIAFPSSLLQLPKVADFYNLFSCIFADLSLEAVGAGGLAR